MIFAEMGAAQFIFLGVVVLTTLFLLLRTSRYFTRPKSPDPSWSAVARRPKDSDSTGRSSRIPQEMAGWEVEMHEFVREIKAELDSKMRALQAVAADADRAAARLEAALQNSARRTPNEGRSAEESRGNVSSLSVGEGPGVRVVPDSGIAFKIEGRPEFPSLRGESSSTAPGIDLSNLPASQAESLSPARVSRPDHSSAQAKKEEIYTLADYQMPPAEIASRVGHPIGEVELILSLREKK
ncbi:MAG: hypothetical protein IT426_19185 [Pirellulales bacterium]|nr:hypothetical protein [Pirellulales bacterium]